MNNKIAHSRGYGKSTLAALQHVKQTMTRKERRELFRQMIIDTLKKHQNEMGRTT